MFVLFMHVVLATMGLVIGLYFGVLLRGVFVYSDSPPLYEEDIMENPEDFDEFDEEDFDEDEVIEEADLEEEEQPLEEDSAEEKTPPKGTLASKIYDKSESWTDFNCSIDGEENDETIANNRITQDDSYNIIHKKLKEKE